MRSVPKVVTAVVLMVIGLEITSFLTLWIYDKIAGEVVQQGSLNDPRVDIDVYADADWAEQYFREFDTRAAKAARCLFWGWVPGEADGCGRCHDIQVIE